MFLHNQELEIFHQGLKQHLFAWGRFFNKKWWSLIFASKVETLIVQCCQIWSDVWHIPMFKLSFLNKYWLHFLDQAFNWLLFISERAFQLQFLDFCWSNRIIMRGWISEMVEKFNFYCFFVDIQTHHFLKLHDITLLVQVYYIFYHKLIVTKI